MSRRYYKYEKRILVERQLEFFERLPSISPQRVIRFGLEEYRYDFVNSLDHLGKAEKIKDIYAVALNMIWSKDRNPETALLSPVFKSISSIPYANYVHDVAFNGRETQGYSAWIKLLIENYCVGLEKCLIHGDMTLENILWDIDSDSPVFIDCGHDRGLPCREQDEAKLLQSLLLQWEPIKWGLEPYKWIEIPFVIRPVHIVLLAAHLIRLANHHRDQDKVLDYVLDVLSYLKSTEELSDASYIRSGWSTDRLLHCLLPIVQRGLRASKS